MYPRLVLFYRSCHWDSDIKKIKNEMLKDINHLNQKEIKCMDFVWGERRENRIGMHANVLPSEHESDPTEYRR